MLRYTHDPALVLLSIFVAVIGCLLGLALISQNRSTQSASLAPLALGSIVVGGTIFSMHFIAMTAVTTSLILTFDILVTVGSLVAACLGTFAGLYISARKPLGMASTLIGGIVMGCAIATMHYSGMSGIANCMPTYTYNGVIVSIGIAVVASKVALAVMFSKLGVLETLVAAVVLGGAICAFHYTAMTSTSLLAIQREFAVSIGVIGQDLLGYVIAGVFVLVSILFFARMADGA
jgi:NO-binding membrane sensor protein with MHYT domain